MKRKIFLYYIVLIIIGVSLTGFFTSQLTQKFYKHEVEERLKNTATLIQYHVSNDISRGIQVDYNELASTYAKLLNVSTNKNLTLSGTKARITFVDYEGKVIGESETNFLDMENHIDRKEIQEAAQGKPGKDIRFSNTLKISFFYIAVPIKEAEIIVRVSIPLTQLKNIDRIIWYYTIIGILSGLILTTLLALKFSASITEPINNLINISKEIAAGNYSKRVKIRTRDELGQLSDTFNNMASKLERTVADLTGENLKVDSILNSMTEAIVAVDTKYKVILINAIACDMFGIEKTSEVMGANILEVIRNNQINTFLEETISSNTSLVNEITVGTPEDKVLRVYTNPIKSIDFESANLGAILSIQDITAIKKLEQIRTEFVSNVTHELKTPLTSIRGFIETLRNGAIDNKEISEKFLEIIDIEAERLYMLINDILQLSEIETRQKDSNVDTYSLKPIIEETVSILKGVADRKHVVLNFEVDNNIKIIANKDRIKQMLINLIDNAIKYNVDEGSVIIKAYKSHGKITISIRDTGIGIEKEHLPRIFERFYRVDKGRSRNMGGTGLGLSIVKHIVNLYSGHISVDSIPGKGTEFIIQFPA